MISICSKKAWRLGLFTVLLTLMISGVSAIEIIEPSGDTADDFQVNVSDFSEEVNLTLEGEDTIQKEASLDGDYATETFQVGDDRSGEYELLAEDIDADGDVVDTDSLDLTVDGTDPEVEKRDDREFVQDNPELEFRVSDDFSAITNFTASGFEVDIDDGEKSDVCSAGGECTVGVDVDTGDVSQGDTFSVDVYVEDMVGNGEDYSFSYTLDDSFQADEPEFEIPEADSDENVDLNGDVDVDIEVDNVDDEESDIQLECLVDGDEVDSTGWDDETDYSCDVPSEEVDDETADISVRACDRAGNCDSSDERSFTFDSEDPEMDDLEASRDYLVFTDDFKVEYEASDTASGVEELEYFFSPGTAEGEGTSVEYDREDSFKVDTALLDENGDHTLYVRAKDRVGRWSSTESIDFEYYPDERPNITIDADDDFSVEANDTGYIDVIVENTGKLLVEEATVEASSQVLDGSNAVEDLEEGDSVNAEFEVSPGENETGEWSVEFASEEPEASDTVDIVVEANSEQRDLVDSRLEEYSGRLSELESNSSELSSSGLNSELNNSLQSEVRSFSDVVNSVQQSADEGSYHRALAELDSLEARYSSASSTLDEVEEEHRSNQFKNTVMMLLLGLVIIGAGAGAFIYTGRNEDLELPVELPEGLELPEMPETGIGVKAREFIEGAKEKLKAEEEQVEEAFEGFK